MATYFLWVLITVTTVGRDRVGHTIIKGRFANISSFKRQSTGHNITQPDITRHIKDQFNTTRWNRIKPIGLQEAT